LYTRIRFPIPGISVLGVRHPADGYGAAAGLGRDEARHATRHARAREPEFARLEATRRRSDARFAPPSLIIGKAGRL